MRTITFTQRYYKKSLILAISYLVTLGIIIFLIWKWNFGIKDFINTLFPDSIPKWFIVFSCLLPLIYFIRFTIKDINISFGINKIFIEDKNIKEIPIKDIQYILVNDPRDATINLYSNKGLLYTFDGYNEDEEVIETLENEIIKMGNFEKIEYTKKVYGTKFQARRYNKI